jgi:WD40 repeat protein/mono/diheme cytochrome c family protein
MMRSTLSLAAVLVVVASAEVGIAADKAASGPINYVDHVLPILKQHCTSCHGETRKRAGLDFSNYEATLRGGSGGKVVVAGRASRSRMLELITAENAAERMPLGGEAVPDDQVKIINNWIAEGLRENAKSEANLPDIVSFTPTAPATGGSLGPAPLPTDLPAIKRAETLRAFPVLTLVAAPRAPLLATSGYECIDFLDASTRSVIGSVAFPEGEPQVLKFNRSGSLLLAAGGRPVERGIAALIDVATGKRLATIGNEADSVLAADLSPDETKLALAGSGREVKIFATKDGALQHTLVKHTDWVTALSFSPDGKLLASGDRIGNIYLWDPATGQIVLPLADHKESIRALVWRADGKVLATCGEDGLIVWWDVAKGMPMTAQAEAHTRPRSANEYGKIAGGVLDAAFGPSGELVTCGRDRAVRVWNQAGKQTAVFTIDDGTSTTKGPAAASPGVAAKPLQPRVRLVPTRLAIAADGKSITVGDSAGRLHGFTLPKP